MEHYERQREKRIERQDVASYHPETMPTREELQTYLGLQQYLVEIRHILYPEDDLPYDYEPSLEQLRQAFACFKRINQLNPKAKMYHQIDKDSVQFVHDPTDPEKVTIKAGTINHFTGQGVYFGVHEHFGWIPEHNEGETFVIEDFPLSRASVSISGVGDKLMASLMVHTIQGRAHFDSVETIHGTQYSRDFNNPGSRETLSVYNDDTPKAWENMKPGLKYFVFEDTNLDDPANDIWWKIDGEYMGHNFNRYILSAKQLKFLDEALGIVDVELVEDDKEIHESYQRVYVREASPLLVSAAAVLVGATEIVFGRPGSDGARLVSERQNILFKNVTPAPNGKTKSDSF